MTASRIVEKSQTLPYPRGARVLHLGLVLLFSFELLNSILALWFQHFSLFQWHILAGLALSFWLTLSWVVYLSTSWGRQLLYVWYWPGNIRAIFSDVGRLSRGRLPGHGPEPGLSSWWQGMFFLLVSWVDYAGLAAWLTMRGYLAVPDLTQIGLSSMRLGTPILLYFWLGHVGMALYHAARRQPLWSIFALW
ncbi:cytochrome b/b6 domain-containing protein [Acidithiobacillus sp. AMEEHan]|uniref:cytochrome b/b6 domain-containing protein n=1 Tax=Acidithiobacillus sp. AMEEHan TaxID=2994951 RepID=UPI0027E406B1|nr:cytochrome b/b6 domain-containing protein [Acidithiobacillus sp. AMEEHan]